MFRRIFKPLGIVLLVAACNTADAPTSPGLKVATSRFASPTGVFKNRLREH